jgi:hypothetical protein
MDMPNTIPNTLTQELLEEKNTGRPLAKSLATIPFSWVHPTQPDEVLKDPFAIGMRGQSLHGFVYRKYARG